MMPAVGWGRGGVGLVQVYFGGRVGTLEARAGHAEKASPHSARVCACACVCVCVCVDGTRPQAQPGAAPATFQAGGVWARPSGWSQGVHEDVFSQVSPLSNRGFNNQHLFSGHIWQHSASLVRLLLGRRVPAEGAAWTGASARAGFQPPAHAPTPLKSAHCRGMTSPPPPRLVISVQPLADVAPEELAPQGTLGTRSVSPLSCCSLHLFATPCPIHPSWKVGVSPGKAIQMADVTREGMQARSVPVWVDRLLSWDVTHRVRLAHGVLLLCSAAGGRQAGRAAPRLLLVLVKGLGGTHPEQAGGEGCQQPREWTSDGAHTRFPELQAAA